MTETKRNKEESGDCEACDVLGDYMSCSDTPSGRPGQTRDKKKDE